MHRVILFCAVLLSGTVLAQKPDTGIVSFYYVVQNPKYFGDEASGWFELHGHSDSAVQKKINDTLRRTYAGKLGVRERQPQEIEYAHIDDTPSGYTDFIFRFPYDPLSRNLRLKDSDSICYLKKEACRYGGGEHLRDFQVKIVPGKMAFIKILPFPELPYSHPDFPNTIVYTFSLITGDVIPNTLFVSVERSRRTELLDRLFNMANQELHNNTSNEYRYARIHRDSGDLNLDSIPISMEMLITVMSGGGNGYYDPRLIYNTYKLQPTKRSDFKGTAYLTVGLWPRDAIPFFDADEWQALLLIYEK